MLTNDVVSMVKAIDGIAKQMAYLDSLRRDFMNDIVALLGDDLYDISIVDIHIEEAPKGEKQTNGTYVEQRCNDSLFAPYSGYGTQYYPIENGQFLAVEYCW